MALNKNKTMTQTKSKSTTKKITVYGLNKTMNFGKMRGSTVGTLLNTKHGVNSNSVQYVRWCYNTIEWFTLSDQALRKLEDCEQIIKSQKYVTRKITVSETIYVQS